MKVPGWAPRERLFHERARAELRAGVTGEDFTAGPIGIGAGALPLIRRGASGGLEQAVRLIVKSPRHDLAARFSKELEGRLVDAVTCTLRPGRQTIRLFLPEVSRPTHVSIGVAAGVTGDAALALVVPPVRKWQVYLAQQTHLDIGYTDPQNLVIRHHRHYLDSVLGPGRRHRAVSRRRPLSLECRRDVDAPSLAPRAAAVLCARIHGSGP